MPTSLPDLRHTERYARHRASKRASPHESIFNGVFSLYLFIEGSYSTLRVHCESFDEFVDVSPETTDIHQYQAELLNCDRADNLKRKELHWKYYFPVGDHGIIFNLNKLELSPAWEFKCVRVLMVSNWSETLKIAIVRATRSQCNTHCIALNSKCRGRLSLRIYCYFDAKRKLKSRNYRWHPIEKSDDFVGRTSQTFVPEINAHYR